MGALKWGLTGECLTPLVLTNPGVAERAFRAKWLLEGVKCEGT